MTVVRVLLFFSATYNGFQYSCVLVGWFGRLGCDPATVLWVVRPDHMGGNQDKSILHLDSFMHAAHLIPIYGDQEMPLDFNYTYSLDAFKAFYVNKYIDHHAYEIAF
jgi:hypothetical protein